MGLAVQVLAWTLALALGAAVWGGILSLFREPTRMWMRGERRDAVITGFALTFGLLVLFALAQIAP
jgi:hypothetical protein